MAYEQKEGDIAVFRVKERRSERGPDWTGKALINGQPMEVSLWAKSDGMLTGSIKPARQGDRQAAVKTQNASRSHQGFSRVPADYDDDPF